MAQKEKTLQDLFHDTLKDIYYAEKKILTALPKMAKAASNDSLRRAFEAPYGTPRLRELARGRRDAVIVVDDLSRPTPAARLLPLVLEELAAGGIEPAKVRALIGDPRVCRKARGSGVRHGRKNSSTFGVAES